MRAMWMVFLVGCVGAKEPGGADTGDTGPEPEETGESAPPGETGETAETGETGTIDEDFDVVCDAYVPDDYGSVMAGIAGAPEGSTLCVRAGEWAGDLDFAGREVLVVGEGVGQTLIVGDGDGRVVSFDEGEGPGAGLQGVTILGGHADGGAGIYVLSGASPTLSQLSVEGNTCVGAEGIVRGVGLYAEGGTLSDIRVRENHCSLDMSGGTKIYGTGAYVNTDAVVQRLEVERSTGAAYEITGALVIKDLAAPIRGVSVHDNQSEATISCIGGGVHISGTTASVSRLDVRANTCSSGGEVRGAGLHVFVEGAITLENVIVAGNVGVAEGTVSGGGVRLGGEVTLKQADIVGNQSVGLASEGAALSFGGDAITLRQVAVHANEDLSASGADVWSYGGTPDLAWCGWSGSTFADGLGSPDPAAGNLFEDPDYWGLDDAAATTWTLTLAVGSPHIDAGDPEQEDEDGSRVDIGAYGGEGM